MCSGGLCYQSFINSIISLGVHSKMKHNFSKVSSVMFLPFFKESRVLLSLGICGFILFYIIDIFFTIGGIALAANKSWGSIVLLIIAVAGISLTLGW